MSNIAKLKKKAADFELKRQSDKALATYIELIQEYERHPDEMDVALYNRVGDLLLRQGNVADAVDYYEKAVDYYGEGGFFNNAIALCNKILRQSPGRVSVYYKLGKISAQKGFTAEAKRNFLEFADRMQKAGKLDEAFRALKEFADLCPDQDDIRLMLADQLQKAGKSSEAVWQLQQLYQRYTAEGRKSEADATAARIRSIDPDAEVRAGNTPLESKAQDLVFLDLNEAPQPAERPTRSRFGRTRGEPKPKHQPAPEPAAEPEAEPEPAPPPEPELEAEARETESEPTPEASTDVGVEPTAIPESVSPGDVEAVPLEGVTRSDASSQGATDEAAPPVVEPLAGLVEASFDAHGAGSDVPPLADLEPTAEGADEFDDEMRWSIPGGDEHGAEETGELELIRGDDLAGESPLTPTPGATSEAVPEEAEPPAAPEEEEAPSEPTPQASRDVGRASTMLAAQSMEMLRAVVDVNPSDWDAHRNLGEAMLEAGHRDEGLREFEAAMKGYESDGNLEAAGSMADEIVRADPSSIKHYQKRVEFAFRSNDRGRLVDAYLELADALFREEQPEKARVIYHRVLELAPDDQRAQMGLSALPDSSTPTPVAATAAPRGETPSDGSFVNLGDMMRQEERPKDTRMVVKDEEPTGDEEADFADMLRKFKQGVAANVDEEDYQSHYDLGIAYQEMGLLDEAIAEFQKALRAPEHRVRTYESIGQCFMEKQQYRMAATLLGRALHEKGMSDDQLVGVLYLLGRACEELGRPEEALGYYQRIFVVDIRFRDVGERMNSIEQATR